MSDAELLEAPLFPGAVLDTVWSQRCDDLTRAVNRLACVILQVPSFYFGLHSVQHLMHCSPSANNSALQKVNNQLGEAVTCWPITNSTVFDAQWLQVSMPATAW